MKFLKSAISSWWSAGASLLLHGFLLFGLGAFVMQEADFAMMSGEGGMAGGILDQEREVVVELLNEPETRAEVESEIPVIPEEKVEAVEEVRTKVKPQPAPVRPVQPVKKRATTVKASGSGGVQFKAKPDYLRNPPPAYPAQAKRLKQQGLVTLNVWVNSKGKVTKVTLRRSSGFSSLDRAAMTSVQRWKFRPARMNGIKVDSKVIVPVRFRLDG